jgi:hypothetical protein
MLVMARMPVCVRDAGRYLHRQQRMWCLAANAAGSS